MSVKKTKVAKKTGATKKANLTVRKTALKTVSSKSISKVSSKVAAKTAVSKITKNSPAKKTVKVEAKPKVAPKKGITVASAVPTSQVNKLATKAPKIVAEAAVKVVATKSIVAKDDIYKAGDKVVYPAHGVGLIDSIQARLIGGQETKFYMITILETGMKVMVPMAQAITVGLRKIVDTKTVEKVYDILRDKDVIVHQQTWNRRHREYTQKLKTGSVFEIASVIRDLSVLKGDKELSFGERKMLDMAQGLLVKEISIAKSKTEDHIKAELQEICDAA
jgi:CarD family transcriptional regulator